MTRFDKLRMPVSMQEHGKVLLSILTALEELHRGRCRKEEWSDLCDAINVVEALVDLKKLDARAFGPLIGEAHRAVIDAAGQIKERGWAVLPTGQFAILRRICGLYDAALGRLSAGTMSQAARVVMSRIVDQKRNPANGVVVVAL